ncbi:MAG: nucleotidyl transferase AbiEii/AbiGii toxin family protein [Acidobacteriota bacterium]|nr:nucleotidyl transferase AbiEii/AbiGii toxin family protein [Acidobacteriota bacterium]
MADNQGFPVELLSDTIKITLQATGVLEQLGIPYLIGGSMASIVHGEPRLTTDLDLVVDLRKELVPALVAALEADYYVDDESLLRAIHERSSTNFIYLETMFKLDIYIAKGDEWTLEQMRLRQEKCLIEGDDSTARQVSNPETTILQKLWWYRRGGEVSEKQWRDVQGVLKVQGPQLDFNYLRHWAAKLNVTDLLDRAFDDAGITPSAPTPPDTHTS